MKNIFKVLMMLVLALALVGCGGGKVEEEVKIIVPQGNPFIAVGNLIGEENINIESVNGAAGVKAGLVGNDYDIVIAPLNLGAQLYVGGKSKYVLDSVIALGNTYIISNKETKLDSIKDLQDKTILAYSQGGTPDIILQYALSKNNVNAKIEYKPSLTEVVPFFVQGQYDYILAAEPVITSLKVNKNKELNVLNLQDVVDATIMQAAIFVNPDSTKQDSINVVIDKIKDNIENMNKNPEVYANSIIEKDVYFKDLTANIMSQSIPNSNLDFVKAKENIAKVESYLTMIGYKLPDEAFYR